MTGKTPPNPITPAAQKPLNSSLFLSFGREEAGSVVICRKITHRAGVLATSPFVQNGAFASLGYHRVYHGTGLPPAAVAPHDLYR